MLAFPPWSGFDIQWADAYNHSGGGNVKMSIDIDEQLLAEAKSVGHHTTDDSAVNEALSEYVQLHKRGRTLDLIGKVEFDPSYDYKAERKRR